MVTTDLKQNLIQSIINFNEWCLKNPEWKGTNKELKGIFYTKLVKNIKSYPNNSIDHFTPNNIFILEVTNNKISKLQFGMYTVYNLLQDFITILNNTLLEINLEDLKNSLPFETRINSVILDINNYNGRTN